MTRQEISGISAAKQAEEAANRALASSTGLRPLRNDQGHAQEVTSDGREITPPDDQSADKVTPGDD